MAIHFLSFFVVCLVYSVGNFLFIIFIFFFFIIFNFIYLFIFLDNNSIAQIIVFGRYGSPKRDL